MAGDARRQRILEALKTRIEAIQIVNGFRTDAGGRVFLHEDPQFGEEDPTTAIAIVVGDDEPYWHAEQVAIRLPIEFRALAKADLEEPWKAAEAVLADLKQAIELEDRTLGRLIKPNLERGTTRTIPREVGSEYVGVGITYHSTYTERWGAPEL